MRGGGVRHDRRVRGGRRAALIAALGIAAAITLAACGGSGRAGTGSPVTPAGGVVTGSTSPATTASRPAVVVPPITTPAPESPITTPDPASPSTQADPTTPSDPPAPTTTPSTPSAPAARITTNLAPGKALNPVTPITVRVTGGTLTAVQLVNPAEHVTVTGTLSANRGTWTSTEVLGYGKTYQLSARAVNADGTPSAVTEDFATLRPDNQTLPYFQTIGGYPLTDGGTFGVGMVAVVHFDEPVTDRGAAEKALHVTTTPHVAGAWNWVDNQDVHWRPATFYRPGTTVRIDADVYGVQVGPGLYGQSDVSTSFTIGRAQITYAYDNAPNAVDKVVVKNGAGKALRTMNTSMGQHGGETVDGNYINFYTMGGTYTVIAHQNPAMMSSASYGLPADAPGGYAPEPIYWSTRISTDGIYLHELNNTIWAQNSGQDVSHGCLNLDTANATWFYQHSLVGDPVIIQGAKNAPKIQIWQGGDWSVPWSTWVAGSALH